MNKCPLPQAISFSSIFPIQSPLLLWLLILLTLSACQSEQLPTDYPPANVQVAHPVRQDVVEWDEFVGRIEPIEIVELKAQVSGYLDKIHYTPGQKVKKGDLLFQIDPRPFQAELNLAQAEQERARAKLEYAQNDLKRVSRLLKAKVISEEEYDNRNTSYQEALAALHSAEARVQTARLNLEFTRIESPIDGRIGREQVTIGNVITDGMDATLLATIVSTDPIYFYADVDEPTVLRYKRQGIRQSDITSIQAELKLSDEANYSHQGHLDYISTTADRNTGTMTVRGVFPNPDELLSAGFFARMRVSTGRPTPQILIPERALAFDQARYFVWVIDDQNIPKYRAVEIGSAVGTLRVIRQGLDITDTVIVDGLQKVRPGIPVKPELFTAEQK
jgi:multidrug efflux system membrane fusion protein